jgi:hypothetical protein
MNRRLNQLQHSYSCSIDTITNLVHDHILRYNLRISLTSKDCGDAFLLSTSGCHHLYLVDYAASLFNKFAEKNHMALAPCFLDIQSNETFGLINSNHILSGDFVKQEAIQEYSFDEAGGTLEPSTLEDIQSMLAEELGLSTAAFNSVDAGALLLGFYALSSQLQDASASLPVASTSSISTAHISNTAKRPAETSLDGNIRKVQIRSLVSLALLGLVFYSFC